MVAITWNVTFVSGVFEEEKNSLTSHPLIMHLTTDNQSSRIHRLIPLTLIPSLYLSLSSFPISWGLEVAGREPPWKDLSSSFVAVEDKGHPFNPCPTDQSLASHQTLRYETLLERFIHTPLGAYIRRLCRFVVYACLRYDYDLMDCNRLQRFLSCFRLLPPLFSMLRIVIAIS